MMLPALRSAMARAGLTIYILPRTDQYQSQFLTPSDQRISYLSNFTGSNALAFISSTQSLLWTDSRYYIQAQKQLQYPWAMKKMQKGLPRWYEYVVEHYKKGEVVGIDSKLITYGRCSVIKRMGNKEVNILKRKDDNLVDQIWKGRPKEEYNEIFVHEGYAGTPALQKLEWIRQKMRQKKGYGCIITDLSEICWILNLRSSQIPFSPFMKSTLVVLEEKCHLYLPKENPCLVNSSKELNQHLQRLNIELLSYPIDFRTLPQFILTKDANYYTHNQLKNPIDWEGIGLQRAKRPQKQRQGFRNSHIRDGVAMAMFWSKRSKMETVGEYEAAQMINNERFKQQLNKGLSFETISAGGPNGAIVHYRPTQASDFQITKHMIHLVDSGGQYLDGTTDVTRAFHFGTPTLEQKDAYTRVLLGNLDIQRLKWPSNFGIKGSHIDVLARKRLWEKGLNYGHGTGHGVGYFQGVHQSPVGISHLNNTVLEEGMVTSNQPGYYKDNQFGIRIQNLLLVVKNKENAEFLRFECLTLCPYDLNLIEVNLLSREDIEYINKYHERCWNILSPRINDKQCLHWLKQSTRKIPIL